jgi:hypothetical protein
MGKQSTCPGCKTKFLNGRPYSVHIGLCKNIDSAANTALKKHKIVTAKRFDEKKAQIAARRELASQAAQNVGASSSQDGREIGLDVDMQEARSAFLISSILKFILKFIPPTGYFTAKPTAN